MLIFELYQGILLTEQKKYPFFSNSFLIQYGTYKETTLQYFPLSFTNVNTFGFTFVPGTTNNWSGEIHTFCFTNITASSFRAHNSNSWSGRWIAIGY